jgi:hypothetical protein
LLLPVQVVLKRLKKQRQPRRQKLPLQPLKPRLLQRLRPPRQPPPLMTITIVLHLPKMTIMPMAMVKANTHRIDTVETQRFGKLK